MATAASGGLFKATVRRGPARTLSLLGIIKKYWYWIILFLVILPAITGSVSEAIQTKNPILPAVDLALHIFNADNQLGEDVYLLQNNPSELIGQSKPSEGVWLTVTYYWHFFWNVIYRIFSNVWLIFFPAVLYYKFSRYRNTSEVNKNVRNTIVFFFLYLFFANILTLIIGLVNNDLSVAFPKDLDTAGQYWVLTKALLPLNGLVSLVIYLVGLGGLKVN